MVVFFHFFAVVYNRKEGVWYNYDALDLCKRSKILNEAEMRSLIIDILYEKKYDRRHKYGRWCNTFVYYNKCNGV